MEHAVVKTILNLIANTTIATKFRFTHYFPTKTDEYIRIKSKTNYHKDVEYISIYKKVKSKLFYDNYELHHLIILYKGKEIFSTKIDQSVDTNTQNIEDKPVMPNIQFSGFVKMYVFFDYEHKPE